MNRFIRYIATVSSVPTAASENQPPSATRTLRSPYSSRIHLKTLLRSGLTLCPYGTRLRPRRRSFGPKERAKKSAVPWTQAFSSGVKVGRRSPCWDLMEAG